MKGFKVPLEQLQPSQLYISRAKLETVQYALLCGGLMAIEPIPVMPWGRRLLMTEGHTRALALCLKGYDEIPVRWDPDPVDLDMYGLCVSWCHQQRIHQVRDLLPQVIDHDRFEILWIERCQKVYEQLGQRQEAISD